MTTEPYRFATYPERLFVSVDESTGRSTISFAPADAAPPILHENDHAGDAAMLAAKAIQARYPTCTVHGPHFHAARPPGRNKVGKKPAPTRGT